MDVGSTQRKGLTSDQGSQLRRKTTGRFTVTALDHILFIELGKDDIPPPQPPCTCWASEESFGSRKRVWCGLLTHDRPPPTQPGLSTPDMSATITRHAAIAQSHIQHE